MNKIANVIFAYSPKNEDELELTVGDKIEVIGFEEEGWWKGRLRGRIGVFPENFVQLVESDAPSGTATNQTASKLNSIFGSRVSTKNSISSNSLNNVSSNNNINTSNNTIKNSVSNNNLIMNNTHQHEGDSNSDYHTSESTNSLGERRPKPLKGIGYGDIFAAGAKTKPLPADPPVTRPIAKATDRPNANNVSSTLQMPIPKKPPPPAPIDNGSTNGSTSYPTLALPPKPINQFKPLINKRTTTPPRTQLARVIYAYKPANDDELELEVGDIIGVLDTNIEDQGWWRGELKGRIGVFPDNFVELIEPATQSIEGPSLSGTSGNTSNSIQSGVSGNNTSQQSPLGSDVKPVIKSVFAGTPKGFSKELESNLEKHSNPASFLSLKRNKLQQQMTTNDTNSMMTSGNESALVSNNLYTTHDTSDNSDKQNGHSIDSPETSPGKLNHITANRAKGPSRRPPSNLLNKKSQFNQLIHDHNKQESSGESKEEPPSASLPVFNHPMPAQPQPDQGFLASLPSEQSQKTISPILARNSLGQQSTHDLSSPSSTMTNSPLDNHAVEGSQPVTPKFSQRANHVPGSQLESKSRLNSESSPSTPPWMVELRKTNAEKKRDPLPVSTASLIEAIAPTSTLVPSIPTNSLTATNSVTATVIPSTTSVASIVVAATTQTENDSLPESVLANHENFRLQISKEITDEIDLLRKEVKKLQNGYRDMNELREAVETMKIELKACQSATESQKRYIKELVNNLADERKKITAMQVEIDRNLK